VTYLNKMRVFRVAILIANIALSLFVASLIYSASTLRFSFPSGVETSTRDSLYVIRAPFSVTNGGFYDISDLDIRIELKNSTGYTFFKNDTIVNVIKAQTTHNGAVVLAINYTDLYVKNAYYNLFHSDTFKLIVTVKCAYAKPMIGFQADVSQEMPWTAPLADFKITVGKPTAKIIDATYSTLSVPFTIDGYDGLYFKPNIRVTVLDSAGDPVNSAEKTFGIQTCPYSANFTISVPTSKISTSYTVRVQITSPFSYGPIEKKMPE